MPMTMTFLSWLIALIAAIAVVALAVGRPRKPSDSSDLAGGEAIGAGAARVVLPSVDVRAVSTRKRAKQPKATIRDRLVQAGFYKDSFVDALRLLRFALLGLFICGGYLVYELGMMPLTRGLLVGIISGLAATIVPGIVLDQFKARRQHKMRRALPDALDIVVVCLEGGLSLPAAFSRVSHELRGVHPVLELELRIVEREIQMGLSLGEAMRNLSSRFDLEELRSLATVVNQSDRYGASVSRAFRVFASGMRREHQQRAEERAHQAAVQLILPTALLIFPAMFVVTVGPAAIRAMNVLLPLMENWKHQSGN